MSKNGFPVNCYSCSHSHDKKEPCGVFQFVAEGLNDERITKLELKNSNSVYHIFGKIAKNCKKHEPIAEVKDYKP